jgi:hypothetical protein
MTIHRAASCCDKRMLLAAVRRSSRGNGRERRLPDRFATALCTVLSS